MGRRKIKDQLSNIENKVEQLFNAPVSGGNTFEAYNEMGIKEELAKAQANEPDNRFVQSDTANIESTRQQIENFIEKIISGKTIKDWMLLNLHANYFCNTIKFKCNDIRLEKQIREVIRGAFLYGKAGIYCDQLGDNLYYSRSCYVVDATKTLYGELMNAQIYPLKNILWNQDKYHDQVHLEAIVPEPLDREKAKNLVIFQWGTSGMGAYVWLWPFIKFHNQLLTQGIMESVFQTTKLEYKMNNQQKTAKELELFANPLNPFFLNISGLSISNKFDVFRMGEGQRSTTFAEYYKQAIAMWYELIGRETNIDFKQERNVVDEVQASQTVFETIQSEWKNQFKLFARELNNHPMLAMYGIEIEYEDKPIEPMEETNEN